MVHNQSTNHQLLPWNGMLERLVSKQPAAYYYCYCYCYCYCHHFHYHHQHHHHIIIITINIVLLTLGKFPTVKSKKVKIKARVTTIAPKFTPSIQRCRDDMPLLILIRKVLFTHAEVFSQCWPQDISIRHVVFFFKNTWLTWSTGMKLPAITLTLTLILI